MWEEEGDLANMEGLKHDREWILMSLSGEILTQKKLRNYQVTVSFKDKFPEGLQYIGRKKFSDSFVGFGKENGAAIVPCAPVSLCLLLVVFSFLFNCQLPAMKDVRVKLQTKAPNNGIDGMLTTKVPEMCFISTFIDLSQGILFVESPHCKERLQIKLESGVNHGAMEELELYGQRYKVYNYSKETNVWFSEAIGKPCTLFRYSSTEHDFMLNKTKGVATCRDTKSTLNFPNEAQFLLVSEESVSDLNRRLCSDVQKDICVTAMQVDASRFRPNLVVSGGRPYGEDGWRTIRIGNKYFRSLGGCNRCQMINFSQNAGKVQKSNEPLATLASYRRVKGKILFGILLKYESSDEEQQHDDSWLHIGQHVHPESI
ncbi:hypothetical protein Ahy_B10g105095 isoform D [Arachis hypogaea]|uniref:MOSC domain-containing protein n=1 Tax=Arachis hypogaea TaxID=3818 RepID=A0A444X749_ARAHY|nr:hypothetical protein Ahy_B10g105095 isoform D [Arachis hypogaea]